MSKGKFKEEAITQWDMRQKLRQISIDTGYFKDGKFNPTDENIQAQIDYEYKSEFVPIEVLEEAKAEFPTYYKAAKIAQQRTIGLKIYRKDVLEELMAMMQEYYDKWFGDKNE
jgi:hypothetical protein